MMRGVLIRTGRMPYPGTEPEYGVMSLDGTKVANLVDWDEIKFDMGATGRIRATRTEWKLNAQIPLTNFLGHPVLVMSPGIVGRIRSVAKQSARGNTHGNHRSAT